MTWPSDVLNLLAMYERGDLTRAELHTKLLRLLADTPPGDLLVMLPKETRADFLAWARRYYDNNVPVDEFLSLQEADIETGNRAIESIRSWFAQERRAGRV
jgi:hypothetical protein